MDKISYKYDVIINSACNVSAQYTIIYISQDLCMFSVITKVEIVLWKG